MKTQRSGGSPTAWGDVHHMAGEDSSEPTRRHTSDDGKNRKWLSCREFLVYFILVPAILIIIQYFVPYPIKDKYFILHLNNPTPWAMFLTNYVHTDDPLHLWGNIIVYYFFIGILPLFNYAPPNPHKWIKQYRLLFESFFFVIVPLAVSTISLFALRAKSGTNILGFSGVDAALIGYFMAISLSIYSSYKNLCFLTLGLAALVAFTLFMFLFPILNTSGKSSPNIIGHIGGFACGILLILFVLYFEGGARNA